VAIQKEGRGFDSLLVRFEVAVLGKLLTCLCHQAVLFGTGRWTVMRFGWEGNRRLGGK